jgi:integrase
LISDMRGDGYAAGTTNNVLMLLCRIFNLAHKWKVPGGGDNPTSGLDRARPNERQRFLILTAEETDRLIASLGEDENRAAAQAIMLLLLTGARRNEITRAKWENVDWTQLCCEYLSRNRASPGRSP